MNYLIIQSTISGSCFTVFFSLFFFSPKAQWRVPLRSGLFNGLFNCVRRIPVQLGTALDYPLVKTMYPKKKPKNKLKKI